MDEKLEWEVDVEGIVGHDGREEERMGTSMSSSRQIRQGQMVSGGRRPPILRWWTPDITCPFVEKVQSYSIPLGH